VIRDAIRRMQAEEALLAIASNPLIGHFLATAT
jgi:hypothetical protein